MRLSLLVLFVLAAVPLVEGQQTGQNSGAANSSSYTLSVKSELVVETVIVRDKQGRFVEGLGARDFVVTEDGVPQDIRFCEYQDLTRNGQALPTLSADNENTRLFKRLNRMQIKSDAPGGPAHNNRRLLALYFDMSAMNPDEQIRAISASEQFLRTQMTAADMVSILRYQGGSVDILQDFSDDRNKLLSILETLLVGEGQGSAESIDDASTADTGAAFGQDDSEFNIFNTDRQLSALQTAAAMLGRLQEKKSLVYFSGGLHLNGIDNQAQLHATVDTALKAGVSFWPIDARGLVAQAPLGDATHGSPGNEGIYTGAASLANLTIFQQSQDTLFSLAGDTGGKALLDTNDLVHGIVQAQRSVSNYYILGYYTTNHTRDGKFRRVEVSREPPSDAKLSYSHGYYADKEFSKFTAVDKESQLEDALSLDNPITELSMAMEIDYFQLNRVEYFVPVVIKIPGSELALAKRRGASRTLIDFVGEIKDAYTGSTITNLRDHIEIKLSGQTAAELAHHPVVYDTGFSLLPGKYAIKLLARDDETGRIGTYQTSFEIPNLNDPHDHVPISSVVLSGQRIDLDLALYNAMRGKQRKTAIAVNPLVRDGQELIPSVTRVFSLRRQINVYLQAYEAVSPGPPQKNHLVVAYVSLYHQGKKVFESPIITPGVDRTDKLYVSTFNFDLDLKNAVPGEYDCQVNVLAPTALKATFWRAPVVLVP